MTEDSGFFTEPTAEMPDGEIELIHRSQNGWSEIYRIRRDGRYLVLKALKEEYRGQALYESLMLKEYQISKGLSHPGIRKVYGMSTYPGLGNVIEMEWIEGCTLDEYTKDRHLGKTSGLRLTDQLCDAVTYLHSRQIVHRDIKPANILITRNGDFLKLIDFGLSDADSWATHKGSCGTPSFTAPEVLDGERPDSKSDIWSMGKVARGILPGSRSQLRRCMASDPARRYTDAAQFKGALHRISPLWYAAAVVAVLLVVGLLLFRPAPQAPEVPEAQMIDNPEVIDELFRQATQMIENQD